MNKVLAVSGGIDSMVLLHIYRNDPSAVIAHFDHGVRTCSGDDLLFVRRVATEYGRPFYSHRAQLGPNASEELARVERYKFLKQLCAERHAKLFTAHHSNDLAESIVINLLRGTGWRGLTPFSDSDICRPLLSWDKSQIYRYATKNNIRFRADSTNTEDKYLRNRVRAMLLEHPEAAAKLKAQFARNSEIRSEIEQLDSELISEAPKAKRELYRELPQDCALELLRYQLKLWQISLTRPQLTNALNAIRDYQPGKKLSLDRERFLVFTKYHFYAS